MRLQVADPPLVRRDLVRVDRLALLRVPLEAAQVALQPLQLRLRLFFRQRFDRLLRVLRQAEGVAQSMRNEPPAMARLQPLDPADPWK